MLACKGQIIYTYCTCEAGIPSDMSDPARSALSTRSGRDHEWKEGIIARNHFKR